MRTWFARGPCNGTLQPTAVVHEAYLRLAAQAERRWQDRAHFKAIAAQAMRQILVDHARRRQATKRGGNRQRVTLSEAADSPASAIVDLLDLDDALAELSTLDERHSVIVQLRFFGGLTVEEIADLLRLSQRTVELDWKMARAWLLWRLEA